MHIPKYRNSNIKLTFAYGRIFPEESRWEACPGSWANGHVTRIASVFNSISDIEIISYQCAVGWLFRTAARLWTFKLASIKYVVSLTIRFTLRLWLTMLANKEEFAVAIGVRPKPSFGAIVAGAILSATGQIPKWNSDVFTRKPFPIATIDCISHQP